MFRYFPLPKKGAAAANELNLAIREIVNPYKGGLPDLRIGADYFRVGDKVMQNKNNSKASNGDIGFIRDIGTDKDKPKPLLRLSFPPTAKPNTRLRI